MLILCSNDAINAQISRSQHIGSYIYNFGNNINWTNNDFEEFNIVLISTNISIIDVLTRMAESQKIQDKTISLTIINKPDSSIQNAQMIFISEDKILYYMSVFDIIENKEILLISENYKNKSYVMLNLYDTDDNKLLFEINKPNILNQNLKISDEMLIFGGTEIDIAEIYLKSQHSLRNMEISLSLFEKQADSLRQYIEKSNLKIQQQQNLILAQTKEIENRIATHQKQILKNIEFEKIIEKQLHQIETDKISLRNISDSLDKNKYMLENQYKEIKKSQDIYNKQIEEIDSINKQIEEKNLVLSDKTRIIDAQKEKMTLLIIFLTISVLFVLLILYIYRQNRKKAHKLSQQQQKIKQINTELNDKNDKLSSSLNKIKLIQQKLIQAEKMASLGTLSAGIAHEINNPINFVYAGINSLSRDFEDINVIINEISKINPEDENLKSKLLKIEKLKKENYFEEAYEAIPAILKDIKLGADRTAEIVKGLRSFSRTDKNDLIDLDIHKGIETTLLLLKNKYKKNITIEKKFYEKNLSLLCNAGKINQVFLNIISNAIDAISKKGKITITTKILDNNIFISIKDTGEGINTEIKEKIFDPFFTTKDVGKGTGLGLSISYGIIKDHNGKIKVISEKGKGSEFIITLPIKK